MPTKPKGGNIYLRLTAATLLPVAIAGLQALLWPYIPPLTWLLFYPAVFFSAWIGGLIGGILATCLAIVLGLQFFVPVEQSQDFRYIYSAVIFGCMGFLFSLVHERLHRASSELQRINALKLDASQARLGLALETANIGLWEWDLNARLQTWSDSLWELYGLTPHSQQPCHETWLTTVNVDDRTETARQLNKAIQTASEIDLEWRIANTAPGRERWLMLRGKPALDAIGRPSLYRGVVLDITHRKKIEHDLQDHEQRLDFALSTLEAGAWELNLQNHIAKRTPLHDRIFGYQEPLPEWTYATFLQHVLPEDREMVDRLFSIVNQTQCDSDFECRIRRADGQIRWIHAKSRTKYDKQGQPLFIAGIVQDISARKQAEIDRRYNEMRYHALVDQAAPEGIFIHDHQGNFIEVNQKACDNLGYLKSELLAMNVMDLEQDFDLASAQSEWSSLKPGMNKTLFGHHRRKDGSRFPVEVSFGLLEFDGQRFYITFVRDISERIRAENERKVNEERLSLQSSALQAVANAIMITSPDGVIEWVNPAFGALTGYPAEEAIGKTPRELSKSGLQKPDIYYELWSSVLSGNIWHGEIVNRRKDGSHYTEEQTITPLMDSQGVIRHYIAIKQDITKRKETEIELEHYRHHLEQLVEERTHELKEARSEAERLSQVKSAFLANMSHEIRTPMNAVLGFCYLLEQQPLNKNALQLINKIHAAGRSLLAIINDILDFSKIEAGRLEIEHVPFHLCDILDNLAALMEASAKHKHLELVITPPVDVNALIGDDLRLQQVLVNLLSNAIKFTERGEVALTINVDSITESKCNLRFAVKDTGIGISPEKLAEIFSAFAQADTTIGRRFGGAGLGLSISQKLVQLMGGRLNVESQPAQGSTFSFVLPLEMGRKHMPALPPPSLEKLNLLIADHSVTARNALINMAQSLNWSADAVDSGDAALLKCAVEKENGFPYDVILLDWKLPEQDGLATALSI
ncbi:MAG: PAS domain S-box protein, partial [Methylomonas sp.]